MFAKLNSPFPSRPMRGGWRMQNARRRERSHSRSPRRNHQCEEQLKDWARGNMSTVRLCQHSRAARRDGKTDPAILRLANIAGKSHAFHDQQCMPNLIKLMDWPGVASLITLHPPSSVAWLRGRLLYSKCDFAVVTMVI